MTVNNCHCSCESHHTRILLHHRNHHRFPRHPQRIRLPAADGGAEVARFEEGLVVVAEAVELSWGEGEAYVFVLPGKPAI